MTACPAGIPPWPCPYDSTVVAEADAWLGYVTDLRERDQQLAVADHLGCMGAQMRAVSTTMAGALVPALRGVAAAVRVYYDSSQEVPR